MDLAKRASSNAGLLRVPSIRNAPHRFRARTVFPPRELPFQGERLLPPADLESDGALFRRAYRRRESESSVCRRKGRKPGTAESTRCPIPRRPLDIARLPRRRQPAAHRDPCAQRPDGEDWTRLPVIGERDIARFATFGTIVEAIGAEPDTVLALTDCAILLTSAGFLGPVALRANNPLIVGCHCASQRLYLSGVPPARVPTGCASEELR